MNRNADRIASVLQLELLHWVSTAPELAGRGIPKLIPVDISFPEISHFTQNLKKTVHVETSSTLVNAAKPQKVPSIRFQ